MLSRKSNNVAVLLAAYNGIFYIEEQLISIQNQSIAVDIYISVDVSTDETFEWCEKYSEGHDNVFLLPYGEKFGGAAANFFRLIREVDFRAYEYVMLSDQDDIWFDDKLNRAVSIMSKGGFKGYSSNVIAFWENGREQLVDKAQPQRKYDYLFEAAGPGCTYVLSSCTLQQFKDSLITNKATAKSISLHDWLIYAYFRRHGFSWFIDKQPQMLYRQHAGNQVGINKGVRAIAKRFGLISNGWYKAQIELIADFIDEDPQNRIFENRLSMLVNLGQTRRKFFDRMVLILISILGLV